MNSYTEGCVLWRQRLRRWEGTVGKEGRNLRSRWIRRRKMGRGVRTQETRKSRTTRKGAKSRKCRKNEKEAKQDVGNHRTGRTLSRRREGNRKGSEVSGEGYEGGEWGARETTSDDVIAP